MKWTKEKKRTGSLLETLARNRNITDKELKALVEDPLSLMENPEDIKGLKEAAEKILSCKDTHIICVFADYDVDGMTSGYVMTSYLKDLGFEAYPYYPERIEGYGLSIAFANQIIKGIFKKPVLVVTVDNGITAIEPVRLLTSHGIDVVVCDHHQPGDVLPPCIVCDPWLTKEHKGSHLAGVAVAWKLCVALEKAIGFTHNYWRKYIPYVTIGTISDVMPMTIENRAIVNVGLSDINKETEARFREIKYGFGLFHEPPKMWRGPSLRNLILVLVSVTPKWRHNCFLTQEILKRI